MALPMLHAVVVAALPVMCISSLVADMGTKDRPVMKVVRLLEDMKAELNKDLESDKAVHKKLTCWCTTNRQEKTKAVELGQTRVKQLEATTAEAVAKEQEMKSKRKTIQEEVEKETAALQQAGAMRVKESNAAKAEQASLLDAGKATDQALAILSKKGASLVQVRWAASRLQAAQILNRVANENADVLQAFLDGVRSQGSFLAVPGESYKPQSGQIVGILKGMSDNFKRDLQTSQEKETSAQASYEALKAAKEGEIASGKKMVLQLDQDLAAFAEKHAQAIQELKDTKIQVESDKAFLVKLEEKCKDNGAEFETRVKDRMTELAAVEEAIQVLNSDEAFKLFGKTTSLLQTRAVAKLSKEQEERRHRAVAVLRHAAAQADTPRLALLAMRLQLDPFTKVKEEIDKLAAELKKQNQDEAEKKDWCVDQKSKNQQNTATEGRNRESLVAKKNEIGNTMHTFGSEIAAAQGQIAEMQKQMQRASANREAENKDFRQNVEDQRVSQAILKKALERMQKVYSFAQTESSAEADEAQAPNVALNAPDGFQKYQKNGRAAGVLSLIDAIIKDSAKAESDAIKAEQKAQASYEDLMKSTNDSITKYNQKITDLQQNHAKARESLVLTETSFNQTVARLDSLRGELQTLKTTCDWLQTNFDARQAARTDEIEALKETKAILSGKKL